MKHSVSVDHGTLSPNSQCFSLFENDNKIQNKSQRKRGLSGSAIRLRESLERRVPGTEPEDSEDEIDFD